MQKRFELGKRDVMPACQRIGQNRLQQRLNKIKTKSFYTQQTNYFTVKPSKFMYFKLTTSLLQNKLSQLDSAISYTPTQIRPTPSVQSKINLQQFVSLKHRHNQKHRTNKHFIQRFRSPSRIVKQSKYGFEEDQAFIQQMEQFCEKVKVSKQVKRSFSQNIKIHERKLKNQQGELKPMRKFDQKQDQRVIDEFEQEKGIDRQQSIQEKVVQQQDQSLEDKQSQNQINIIEKNTQSQSHNQSSSQNQTKDRQFHPVQNALQHFTNRKAPHQNKKISILINDIFQTHSATASDFSYADSIRSINPSSFANAQKIFQPQNPKQTKIFKILRKISQKSQIQSQQLLQFSKQIAQIQLKQDLNFMQKIKNLTGDSQTKISEVVQILKLRQLDQLAYLLQLSCKQMNPLQRNKLVNLAWLNYCIIFKSRKNSSVGQICQARQRFVRDLRKYIKQTDPEFKKRKKRIISNKVLPKFWNNMNRIVKTVKAQSEIGKETQMVQRLELRCRFCDIDFIALQSELQWKPLDKNKCTSDSQVLVFRQHLHKTFARFLRFMSFNPSLINQMLKAQPSQKLKYTCYFSQFQIQIDNIFPFFQGKPAFVHSHSLEGISPYWPLFVEKAFAKIVGGYSKLYEYPFELQTLLSIAFGNNINKLSGASETNLLTCSKKACLIKVENQHYLIASIKQTHINVKSLDSNQQTELPIDSIADSQIIYIQPYLVPQRHFKSSQKVTTLFLQTDRQRFVTLLAHNSLLITQISPCGFRQIAFLEAQHHLHLEPGSYFLSVINCNQSSAVTIINCQARQVKAQCQVQTQIEKAVQRYGFTSVRVSDRESVKRILDISKGLLVQQITNQTNSQFNFIQTYHNLIQEGTSLLYPGAGKLTKGKSKQILVIRGEEGSLRKLCQSINRVRKIQARVQKSLYIEIISELYQD